MKTLSAEMENKIKYNVTFNNGFDDTEKKEKAERHLYDRLNDIRFYWLFSFDDLDDEFFMDQIKELFDIGDIKSLDEIKELIDQYQDLPSFFDYGLGFDYVEMGTFPDQDKDYYRYQISWGGPSEEFRIYENGDVEFVFLDWFCGIGWRVDKNEAISEMVDWFQGVDMINFDRDREESNYYEFLEEE